MKISKRDALMWFRFFAELPEGEPLPPHQQEIALATFAQIEAAEDARIAQLQAQIPQPSVAGGAHVLRRRRGELSRGLSLVSAGHGPERHPQDQSLQCAVQILL